MSTPNQLLPIPDDVDLPAIEAALAEAEAVLAGDLPATVENVAQLVQASVAAQRLADALDPPEPARGRISATDFRRLEMMAVITGEILRREHRAAVLLRRAFESRDRIDLDLAQEAVLKLPKAKLRQIVGLLQAAEASASDGV